MMLNDKLRVALFKSMVRVRIVEEAIAEVYAEQEMRCPVHLSLGQEAAVGACFALQKTDYVFSGHRSHAHYLGKGGDLRAMISEIYGRKAGCCGGKGGSMHLLDLSAGFLGSVPIVGSTIPIATGAAFGSKLKSEKRTTLVFFGDGATESGVFHESLNFGSLHKLPLIFFCENNLYSVYSPMSVRQPNRSIGAIAEAHGIKCFEVDGMNVEAVFTVTQEALALTKSGRGPVYIEMATYRWREHCGPNYDNDLGYRSVDEYDTWSKRDAVISYEKKLIKDGVLSLIDVDEIKRDCEFEIAEAISFAKNASFPSKEDAARNVYACGGVFIE